MIGMLYKVGSGAGLVCEARSGSSPKPDRIRNTVQGCADFKKAFNCRYRTARPKRQLNLIFLECEITHSSGFYAASHISDRNSISSCGRTFP